MDIGVYLSPRALQGDHDPGHMCVWWEADGIRYFRGFFFKQSDLPKECRSPEHWRDYLFDNCVPGHVLDDIVMRDRLEEHAELVLSATWQASKSQQTELTSLAAIGPCGSYSFNPDNHPQAYNCVTWAVSRVNNVLGPVLPKVRQGRIKLMTEELKRRASAERS